MFNLFICAYYFDIKRIHVKTILMQTAQIHKLANYQCHTLDQI